jgi:hypothetical protein
MENMDHVREHFEALEQQTEPWQQQTRTMAQRLRWGRIPSSYALSLGQGF